MPSTWWYDRCDTIVVVKKVTQQTRGCSWHCTCFSLFCICFSLRSCTHLKAIVSLPNYTMASNSTATVSVFRNYIFNYLCFFYNIYILWSIYYFLNLTRPKMLCKGPSRDLQPCLTIVRACQLPQCARCS